MAFTTSNVQGGSAFGPLKFYCGDYSGTAGDAAGTITLNGGRVYTALFSNQDNTSPTEDPDTNISVSGQTITITVGNHQTVTNGRFLIIYA